MKIMRSCKYLSPFPVSSVQQVFESPRGAYEHNGKHYDQVDTLRKALV